MWWGRREVNGTEKGGTELKTLEVSEIRMMVMVGGMATCSHEFPVAKGWQKAPVTQVGSQNFH